tara:strand:+ start:300 stop:473 length:174 start_codon:yes stop_codon:yes gene_type:complete
MMDSYNKITELLEDFHSNHEKNTVQGVKAAGLRARKVATDLKKLLTQYRRESIEENK